MLKNITYISSHLRQGPSSKAFLAAFTARLISSASPSATFAMTSPVRGSRVGNVLPKPPPPKIQKPTISDHGNRTSRLKLCLFFNSSVSEQSIFFVTPEQSIYKLKKNENFTNQKQRLRSSHRLGAVCKTLEPRGL